MNKKTDAEDYKIADYDHILSSIGNAYFSGVSFKQLWQAVSLSKNREELDAAVAATIRVKEIKEGKKKDG